MRKELKIKNDVKATSNQDKTVRGIKIKNNIKAGSLIANHNRTIAR